MYTKPLVEIIFIACPKYPRHILLELKHHTPKYSLIDDDIAALKADKLDFILHVGDFIYETRSDDPQILNEDLEKIPPLINPDGLTRIVPQFPSGGGELPNSDATFALTLEDYRHLYKVYLSDPDLQEARARWPFIQTWDDHEFTNDAWQSQANYLNAETLEEPSQTRKVSANQAWFEYIPSQIPGDFVAPNPPVSDTAFSNSVDNNGINLNSDNIAAIDSMTIYRKFNYGTNCELILTDLRSYRSDHAIPEQTIYENPLFFAARSSIPLEMLNIFDAGETANDGNPPDEVMLGPFTFQNARKNSPAGSCLGGPQKQWLKDSLVGSTATWKIWANSLPLMRLLFDKSNDPALQTLLVEDRVYTADAWDGYNTERKEMMKYILDNNIPNVVSLSGDLHASVSGFIMDDFDMPSNTPVMTEFTAGSITSETIFATTALDAIGIPATSDPIVYDATTPSPPQNFIENLNAATLYNTDAALAAAATMDAGSIAKAAIEAARGMYPDKSPFVKYIDTNSKGFGRAKITANNVQVSIVTIDDPFTVVPSVKRTANFVVPKVNAGDLPQLQGPEFTGTKPWPVILDDLSP